MKLTILHLSDIHLKSKNNTIIDNVEQFLSFIECEICIDDDLIIIVSGDIAYSGNKEEYLIAKNFFDKIESRVDGKVKTYSVLMVAGNHDCDFSDCSDPVRKIIIDNIDNKGLESVDIGVADEMVKIQKNFSEFSKSCMRGFTEVYRDSLMSVYSYNRDGCKIIFKCLNSAWLSQKHENAGKLIYPVENFTKTSFEEEDHFCISIQHHSFGWFSPDNSRSLKKYLEKTSSLIITGHDHVGSAGIKSDFESDNTELIEGLVLQDSNDKSKSGFNVLKFNFIEKSHCVKSVELNDENIYEGKLIKDWFLFEDLRGVDRSRTFLSESFKRFITNSEVNFYHSQKDDIKINDVFVYPDLTKIQKPDKKSKVSRRESSKLLFEISKDENRYLVIGEEKCGKTTLLKKIFSKLFDCGYCPVYIEGKDIRSTKSSDIDKLVSRELKKQYGEDDHNKLVKNNKTKKCIIIDDFHISKLNSAGKAIFLEHLNMTYDHIYIAANSMVIVEEISSSKNLYEKLVAYGQYSINNFGRLLRYELVDKWNRIGQEFTIDEKDLIAKNDKMLRVVNGIVGKNLVPSYPMFLLTIVQSIEAGTSFSPKNSTFGYYYEFLITRAFGQSGKKPDELDLYYHYATELSWRFFEGKTRELSRDSYNKFHEYFSSEFQNTDKEKMLETFKKAKIIEEIDGSYRFPHKYVYYFFVAKHISNQLSDDENSSEVRGVIEKISERVHIEEFFNILMFLTHFSRNPFVLDTILSKSKSIFSQVSAIKLDDDIAIVNSLMESVPSAVLVDSDYKENRKNELKRNDELEIDQDDPYYSQDYDLNANIDNLNYVTKLNLAFKSIEILGQIVRNHFGSLRKPVKYDVAEQAYMIGLRSLHVFFTRLQEDCDRAIDVIKRFLEEKKLVEKEEVDKVARCMIFNFCEMISFCFMKKVASSLGSEKLFETFSQVLEKNNYPSFRLIDLFIKLEFENNIPFDEIKKMNHEFQKNVMTQSVMKKIVMDYVYMFPTTALERQKVCSVLGIEGNEQKHLDKISYESSER